MLLTSMLLVGAGLYCARQIVKVFGKEPASDAPPEQPVHTETNTALATPGDSAISTVAAAHERDEAERENDHSLLLAGISCGVAIVGCWIPPLNMLASGLLIYSSLPLFRRALTAIFEEKRIRAAILDSFAIVIALGSGFYVIVALSSVIFYAGRGLLLKSQDRSQKKLQDLFYVPQRTAWVLNDGVEIETPIEALQIGDIVTVQAGQIVPIDGVIVDGIASVDQHRLTGEAQPAQLATGDWVIASTLVETGRIAVKVERTGAATVVGQIGTILAHTEDYRASMEFRSEKIGDVSVLPLLGLSAIGFTFIGSEACVAILNSNFSDNVRVALPLGMFNFLNMAANRGILIKDGRVLELLPKVNTIVFDKTGTLTVEQPQVGTILAYQGFKEDEVLHYAAICEARQKHPIAQAILKRAQEASLSSDAVENTDYRVGYGIAADIKGRRVLVGSLRYMLMSGVSIPPEAESAGAAVHAVGHSMIYVAVDAQLAGSLEIVPTLRSEVREMISAMRDRGLALYILSGDHEAPTRKLAAELGIDHYFAQVLPADKAKIITQLREEGHSVCFIGDGINDCIALKAANVSISLMGAMTAATDTAQIVLMDGNLSKLHEIFTLADEFEQNTQRSLIVAMAPGAVSVVGVLFFHFGIIASAVLLNLSLLACVVNAMMPVWRTRRPLARDAGVSITSTPKSA